MRLLELSKISAKSAKQVQKKVQKIKGVHVYLPCNFFEKCIKCKISLYLHIEKLKNKRFIVIYKGYIGFLHFLNYHQFRHYFFCTILRNFLHCFALFGAYAGKTCYDW